MPLAIVRFGRRACRCRTKDSRSAARYGKAWSSLGQAFVPGTSLFVTFAKRHNFGISSTDGYMSLVYPAGEAALAAFAKLRALTREVWRDPSATGARGWASPDAGAPEDCRREIKFWREAGVSHVTAHATNVAGHHKRIASRNAAEYLMAITRHREAVADLL